MRFGHFRCRNYTIDSFVLGADGAYRLTTDWHRYQGMRRYVLIFSPTPRWNCLRYSVRRADSTVVSVVTAADILRWHFAILRENGETLVFRPVAGQQPTRQRRKAWLQRVLLAALPLDEDAARDMVKDVTPHAWRAGLAGDLLHAEVAWNMIATWCRWHSMRAMRMYATRPALATARRSLRFRPIR